MHRYPVLNLGRSRTGLGQAPPGRTLLEQACDAINYYNMFPDVDSESMAAKQAAVAAMRGLFQSARATTQEDFEQVKNKIRKGCNAGEALLSQIQPTTPTMTTPYNPVQSIDTRPIPTTPLGPGTPGLTAPGDDIASIDRTFRVSTREENPPPPEYEPFTVSSREENPPPPEYPPFTVSSREENPPPYEPPPPYQPPPPVASQGNGCFYCAGQGYRWGAPSSGCERTGLNQSDCENLARLDLDIRGIAQTPAMTPPQPQIIDTPATGGQESCTGPGVFWDGRECRGSVRSGFGNYGGIAFGGGGGMTAAPSFMGSRFPVINLARRG